MGQHKFNPVAQAAKEGEDTPIQEGHPMLQPPRRVKTWEELDGMLSWDGKYKIEVDLEGGNGQIVPTFEVEDKDYWDHHEYLSTHTFYEKTHRMYTNILQSFGFNVELVSWG